MHALTKRLTLLGLLAVVRLAPAAEFEITQKEKKFNVKALTVKVGDTVNFRNNDPFFHNIFSLSETKTFDLGSYPQGQSRNVKFDKPGKVEVECAIHPEMKVLIDVQK